MNNIIHANVIYLKTEQPDFYVFSNINDEGYSPQIRTLKIEDTFYFLVASKFKLKHIKRASYNRLDIYMSVSDGLALGNRLVAYAPCGTLRPCYGNPESGRQGDMELPIIIGSYQTGCYSMSATVAGRMIGFVDETGGIPVHIDLEREKDQHRVMEGFEIHLALRIDDSKSKSYKNVSAHYFDALKLSTKCEDFSRAEYDPIVYGTSAGLITIELQRNQVANLGAALVCLANKAKTIIDSKDQ